MREYIDKKTIIIVICIEVMALVLGIIDLRASPKHSVALKRPAAGGVAESVEMEVESKVGKDDVSVSVSPLARSSDAKQSLIDKAKIEIDQSIAGNNQDLSNITDDLMLMGKYQEGEVKASWSFDNYNVIDSKGRLVMENIESDTPVQVSCRLECEDISEIYTFNILIKKPGVDSEKGYEYLLRKSIKEADEGSVHETELVLPKAVEGINLDWKIKRSNRGIQMALIGVMAGIAMVGSQKSKERSDQKKLNKLLSIDYPEIVSMLSLYVSAGISVKTAFQRIGEDYKKRYVINRSPRPGFEAVLEMLRQMEDGYGEIESYKLLGRRIKHKDYRRLSIILVQNVKKGSLMLSELLEKEERHTFEERKLRAKIAGEEASTKLLLPMMGLLGIVLIVLIYPAISGIVI